MSIASPDTATDLAALLIRVARGRGREIEHLRAEHLLSEARIAWPGEPDVQGLKWLAEATKSLGLRTRIARLSLEKALRFAQDGALLVGESLNDTAPLVVYDFDGSTVQIAAGYLDGRRKVSTAEFTKLVDERSAGTEEQAWLIVEDLELTHETSHHFHHRPVRRLLALLRPEKSDIWVVVVFAFFAGVLSLATPIAVESLVNIVMFGQLLQPLLILSLMLFAFLAFAAAMRAMQTFAVEVIQRRLFVRVAADLAYRFPKVCPNSLHGEYGPELANRFFDIVTLQKVVAQMLLDGISIVLTTLVGMSVLAFYNPWLLGFDLLLLATVIIGVLGLGRGAIAASILESKQKYKIAAWFEDLLRCTTTFKISGAGEFAVDRANNLTAGYLSYRQKHFSVLFRQLLFILGLQAVAGTVLLGFGGWLVIREELSVGQLVAAELIVAAILSSLAKLGKHIEGFYDVVAAVDKLGHLFDLDMEPQDGLLALPTSGGARLRMTDVTHSNGGSWLKQGVTLSVDSGQHVALLSSTPAETRTLFDILYGLSTPEAGHVEIEHTDPRDVRPDVLRQTVSLVREVELFTGTIAENVHLGRPTVTMTDIRTALQAVDLLDTILRLPDGLDTLINATGAPLASSQLLRLMLARGIVGQPSLMLVDGTFDHLPDATLESTCQALVENLPGCTFLVATQRKQVADHFPSVMRVDSGRGQATIKEQAPSQDREKPDRENP